MTMPMSFATKKLISVRVGYAYAADAGMAVEPPSGPKASANGWSRAVNAFDAKLDAILGYNDLPALQKFKDAFWLDQDIGDFAGAVTRMMSGTIQYGSQYSFYTGGYGVNGSMLYIDAVCSGKYFPAFINATATDTDLIKALQGLTKGFLAGQYGVTGDNDTTVAVFNSDNNNQDVSVNNTWRVWFTQFCKDDIK
ncbi:hypothetical protein HDU76_000661 [Blyttiomyces sp. JEL0837]|nr:hypothetical protein HDU76_000661 [Blyttiomyces sp. JEL0837]